MEEPAAIEISSEEHEKFLEHFGFISTLIDRDEITETMVWGIRRLRHCPVSLHLNLLFAYEFEICSNKILYFHATFEYNM